MEESEMQAVTRIKPRESLRPWFELTVLYHDQWTTTNNPPSASFQTSHLSWIWSYLKLRDQNRKRVQPLHASTQTQHTLLQQKTMATEVHSPATCLRSCTHVVCLNKSCRRLLASMTDCQWFACFIPRRSAPNVYSLSDYLLECVYSVKTDHLLACVYSVKINCCREAREYTVK